MVLAVPGLLLTPPPSWGVRAGFEPLFEDIGESRELVHCVQEQLGFVDTVFASLSIKTCNAGETLQNFKCVDCFKVVSRTRLL